MRIIVASVANFLVAASPDSKNKNKNKRKGGNSDDGNSSSSRFCSRGRRRVVFYGCLCVVTGLLLQQYSTFNPSSWNVISSSNSTSSTSTSTLQQRSSSLAHDDVIDPIVRTNTSSSSSTTTTTTTTPQRSSSSVHDDVVDPIVRTLKSPNNNSSSSSNKTLMIMIGSIRGGEDAWDSAYRNVLDVNNADLALFVGDYTSQNTSSLLQRAKYVWQLNEYDDWSDAIDNLLVKDKMNNNNNNNNNNNTPSSLSLSNSNWRHKLIPLIHRRSKLLGGIKDRKGKNYKGSGAIIFIIRWMLLHLLQQQQQVTKKYYRFIITRTDHYYLCPHNLSELVDHTTTTSSSLSSSSSSSSYLWVPAGEDYYGVTDRHLVVNSENLFKALNVLPPIISNPANYSSVLRRPKTNPERLLLHRWTEEGLATKLRRFNRTFFTCGVQGDTTRWRKLGKFVQPENVYLKYQDEYDAAHRVCRISTKGGKRRKRKRRITKPISPVSKPRSDHYNDKNDRERLRAVITSSNKTNNNIFGGNKTKATSSSSSCTVRFKDPTMSLCYFVPYNNNFGDELGPAVALAALKLYFTNNNDDGCGDGDDIDLSKIPRLNLHKQKRRGEKKCLFLVGSIFHMIGSNDHVYGTGINPNAKKKKIPGNGVILHSVRGFKTDQWLKEKSPKINRPEKLGHGDPGFLIPFLYPEFQRDETTPSSLLSPPSDNKRHCFVPHFHDLNLPEIQHLRKLNITIISPHASWREVVGAINQQCDCVASSSLHGLIVAQSMGIPTLWVQFKSSKTEETEGDFKYRDYLESIVSGNEGVVSGPAPSVDDIVNRSQYSPPLPLEERIGIAKSTIESFPVRLFEIR